MNEPKKKNVLMNVCADRYLMHYGTKGMHRGQHDPNKRWQSHAVYAQGKPNPNARVRGAKDGSKYSNHLDAADAANEIAKLTNDGKLKLYADDLRHACKKGDEKAISKSMKNINDHLSEENNSESSGGHGVKGMHWNTPDKYKTQEQRDKEKALDNAWDKLDKAGSAIRKQEKKQAKQEKIQSKIADRTERARRNLNKLEQKYKDARNPITKAWANSRKQSQIARLGRYAINKETPFKISKGDLMMIAGYNLMNTFDASRSGSGLLGSLLFYEGLNSNTRDSLKRGNELLNR